MAHTQESYQLIERQTLGLLDNQLFRSTILNLFKGLKKTIWRELKETTRRISHQIENVNRDRSFCLFVFGFLGFLFLLFLFLRKSGGNQTEILELKNNNN